MKTSDISHSIIITLCGFGKSETEAKCKLLGFALNENKVPSTDRAVFSDDSHLYDNPLWKSAWGPCQLCKSSNWVFSSGDRVTI